ncbi:hypothetical protein ABFS83_04G172300 [Erythranthe nasuta]
MAYAAVCCIEQTLKRLLNSSHISIVQNSSPQIINLLYEEILSLREALREFDECRIIVDMKMVKTLEAEIIDVVYKFEDVIDLHISNQFHSLQSDEETDHPPLMVHSLDVQEIKQDIDSFIEMVDKMKRAYTHELCNPTPHDEEDGFFISTRIDFGGNESNMVGLSDQFTRIKGRLLNSSQSERMVVCLAGMAGIGKTTLAKKLCQDPLITSHFSAHVFVTIGPKWRSIYTLIDILKQLDPRPREIMLLEGEEVLDCLKRSISESLKGLRYLIVLDDVWNEELELVNIFPDDKNGSRVLLTTRIEEVGKFLNCGYNVRFLDKKESWDLLRRKVFGEEESFSYALERAGKKIAENCEGLPLTIVTVGDILSKSQKTLEYWNEVADEKQHSVYKDAYDQMSNVLYPSYDYLPQHLKACFLYIGAFPQSYMLHVPRLMNLWSAEGFPDSEPILSSDPPTIYASNTYYYYICELRRKSVVMFDRKQRGYRLHSSFWYLCNKEAAKNKLFYALNCRADALREEGTNFQPRRLCIRNNVLLAIEEVHDSIASASTVRSLLCTGPFHQYYVSLSFLKHLRLLRVLHALSIRFYEFPMEVVKLVQLRYLSLLYDGDIPPSISKLWNLEYLIFGRHLSIIKSVANLSYLPVEIWTMKELKHINVMGRDLPHPGEGSLLPNLVELIGVGPQSCTKDVLEKILNVMILGIHINLAHDASEQLSCFDHISHLRQLKALTCDIANPIFKTGVVTPLVPLSDFPSSLIRLELSGLGYPWEEMRKISALPNLQFLKLECYAFRGPKWEVRDNEFQSLSVLHIEDTDLEQWTFRNFLCPPEIMFFCFEHCYKLKEIPLTFGKSLRTVEVLDCNPLAVNCANKLKEEWDDKYSNLDFSLCLNVRSSWDDGNTNS